MTKKTVTIVNLFFSFAELITFFVGVQFFSGDICQYWRCQTVVVTFWVCLIFLHFMINLMLATSFHSFEE